MIFPVNESKHRIAKIIFQERKIKISELLRKTNTSTKAGYRHIEDLLSAGIINEEREGERPILRVLKPNLDSPEGKHFFSLIESQKRMDFLDKHPRLKGPLRQFGESIDRLAVTALIFGSYARGTENKESDIDIALVIERDTKAFDDIVESSFVSAEKIVSVRKFRKRHFLSNKDEMINQMIGNHVVIVNDYAWINLLSQRKGF